MRSWLYVRFLTSVGVPSLLLRKTTYFPRVTFVNVKGRTLRLQLVGGRSRKAGFCDQEYPASR